MKNIMLFLLPLFILSVFTNSCSDADDNVKGVSGLKITLTDAPGDYDAVYIDVVDVKVKNNDDSGEDGWVSLENVNKGIYNLLDLTGGVTLLLADNEIPSGYLGQIRLVLGENNTVVKNGIVYPLKTPSAQQSGLKLKINQTLQPFVNYSFLIDFDVNQSVVVQAGNSGNFNLHPVLRISTEAISGSIGGKVNAGGFQVLASVMVDNTMVSAYTDSQGNFILHGLPSGVYSVTLTPDAQSGLNPLVIENVIVVNGETTNVGEITL